jgi:putative PIN family toxin of toxin-antitoxin system
MAKPADYDIVYDIIVYRLVIDTDVMVAAFDSPTGASRQLLLSVLDGKALFLLSTSLILEYEAVLTRPEILKMVGLGADEVLAVLDELASSCVPVAFDYRWRPAAKDPDDDLVLETAVNGYADVIATFNIADLAAGAAPFGIAVERPASVLRRIMG